METIRHLIDIFKRKYLDKLLNCFVAFYGKPKFIWYALKKRVCEEKQQKKKTSEHIQTHNTLTRTASGARAVKTCNMSATFLPLGELLLARDRTHTTYPSHFFLVRHFSNFSKNQTILINFCVYRLPFDVCAQPTDDDDADQTVKNGDDTHTRTLRAIVLFSCLCSNVNATDWQCDRTGENEKWERERM